jgi:hypothetical protein
VSPERIEAFILRLRPLIQAARSHARQGDLLVPAAEEVVRAALRAELTGPGSERARAAVLLEGNPRAEPPPAPVVVEVNAPYPLSAPVSTVPPNVLVKLRIFRRTCSSTASWADT